MSRLRRQIDTAELLLLRQEDCSFPEIASRLRSGLGTVHRTYQAASGAPQLFQKTKATVLEGETNNTQEPGSAPDTFDLPPRIKIQLWALRFQLERASRLENYQILVQGGRYHEPVLQRVSARNRSPAGDHCPATNDDATTRNRRRALHVPCLFQRAADRD
jgi:hypothetical protein